MTSIFSSSWMCRLCGREACAECFTKVRELTQYRPGASDSEIAALQAKRESHAHTNPFFLSCTRRNEHQYSDFSPMSRFDKTELEGVIESMEKLLQEEAAITLDPATGLSPSDSVVAGSEAAPNTVHHRSTSPAKGLPSTGGSTGGHGPPPDSVSVPGLLVLFI
jgi:[histone H3]-dimethyl-L-lysine9 demethylase